MAPLCRTSVAPYCRSVTNVFEHLVVAHHSPFDIVRDLRLSGGNISRCNCPNESGEGGWPLIPALVGFVVKIDRPYGFEL